MTRLSLRTLNRTLLDRQFLLARTDRSPLAVIERLVALQGQEPNWPYIGLWTRINGFVPADLVALLTNRQVVRSGLLRSTQHLATADDFRWLRPQVQPALDRTAGGAYFRRNADLDPESLVAEGLQIFAGEALSRKELTRRLAERYPGCDGRILAGQLEFRTPLIAGAATGAWGSWGNRSAVSVTPAAVWLGHPMGTADKDSAKELVRRYLTGFGPASVRDVQSWSGLTRLNEVVDRMGGELRRYHGPDGQELFDLADAELTDAEAPAPVRLLPAFDNVLLGHADRSRIISDEDRKRVMPGQARVLPTFLVDGKVHGTWSRDATNLRIEPFRSLRDADRESLEQEADRLLPFLGVATVAVDEEALG